MTHFDCPYNKWLEIFNLLLFSQAGLTHEDSTGAVTEADLKVLWLKDHTPQFAVTRWLRLNHVPKEMFNGTDDT